MIYDTFPFFNELELLEVRLHELDPVVDRFVLAEATRTHSNKPKPLHFQENRSRFERFLPKITHVIVDDMPDTSDAWSLERHQRSAVGRGLGQCRPDDLILHSDVDEIPRAAAVAALSRRMVFRDGLLARAGHQLLRQPGMFLAIRNLLKKFHPFVWVFEQRQFYFHLNLERVDQPVWLGTRATFFRDFTTARDLRRWSGHRLDSAGWHFSYMGGADRVRQKIQAYAHQEHNVPEFTDLKRIESKLQDERWIFGDEQKLRPVELDESFPNFITANRQKFTAWLNASHQPEAFQVGESRR